MFFLDFFSIRRRRKATNSWMTMVCQGWMVTFIALWHLEDYSPWSAGEVSKALETFLEHKKEKNKNENDVKAF